MSEKRFIVENDNNEVSIKDNVKDNYPFALAYEHIDDADNLIQECLSLVGLLNGFCDEKEQLKNYFKKRAECSNFQINKLKEEIAELQEDNVDTIVELSKENEQLAEENKQLHYKIIELQDKLGMSEKVIDDE